MSEQQAGAAASPRVAETLRLAAERREHRRARLRPLAWALVAVAVAAVFSGHPSPSPSTSARGAGVLAALCAYVAIVAVTMRSRRLDEDRRLRMAVVVALGCVAVALAALQTRGATELPAATAVWVAVSGLPGRAGLALGTAVAAGASIAGAAAGASASEIAAALLLYALLGLMAHYMAQARDSQERTELLLAELQDARDEQARAAALAERARIAGELHDVLAHSLSGAAIQLQGARKLAERDGVGDDTAAAIARAVELVRGGLDDARRAVGALRGGERPSLERFEALVAGVGDDLGVEATARVEGVARPLPADAAHALRRAVQEALTNAARHAPGARAEVVLAYGARDVTLTVEDRGRARTLALAAPALADAGGGRGLAGMRERAERAGGSLRAGPTREGWRVELRVPA